MSFISLWTLVYSTCDIMFVICGAWKVYNKDNKSPGEDGLTAEFHKHFFDLDGTDLIKSLDQSFEDGELCLSVKGHY